MTRRSAIVYDFDGTLSPGSMQQHSLLPELGFSNAQDFWNEVKLRNKNIDGDEILTYMHCLLSVSAAGIAKDDLARHGQILPLFEGVVSWFDRINSFASDKGLELEHYIVSSGFREMIESSSIAANFKHIFASRYAYENGKAVWPAVAVNYTTKTQYLFRINKGVENNWDDKSVNTFISMNLRPIPFERMIFIGDGDTDIPSMKMIKHQGGYSVAVFDEEKFRDSHQEKVYQLISEDRANYVCPADYRNGSQLDVTIKGILGRISMFAS